MSIKVLVFESDAAFAGELRNELGKLGCSTCVVDDGTVGLQQASAERPDLILLSIELPRMNGFSVCNKLKKDAGLKNVPLIIMSSESSDETFEQHRKLRTRAEDYVHKPIAFGELLQHIRTFVPMEDAGTDGSDSDGIVIDDEISVQARVELEEEGTVIGGRIPIPSEPAPKAVDADIDAFTESAFGMLQDNSRASEPPPPPREVNGAHDVATRPPGPAPASIRPTRPPPVDPELGRLHAELERANAKVQELERGSARVAELERDLAEANEKIAHIHEEADAEAERKQREVDDLKTRLQQTQQPGGKAAGGVSTREFLDLREALNKKDKEILALKEAVSSRDREVFEGRDKTLAVERSLAESEEKIVAKDRELADLGEKTEEVTGQLKAMTSKGAELQGRLDKTSQDLQSTAKELADLQRKREDENATHDAALASVREELSQVKASAEQLEAKHSAAVLDIESRHKVEIDEAAASRQADAEEATKERDEALAQARADADAQRAQAIAGREKDLRAEADAKLAALHRAHQDELTRARSEAASQAETARREAEERLAAKQAELAASHAEAMTAADARADARVAEAVAKGEAALGEAKAATSTAEERVAELGRELEAANKATSDVTDAKGASDAANEARIADLGSRIETLDANLAAESGRLQKALSKWDADKGTLERAKDALAVALSQIDEVEGRPIDS